MVTLRWPIYLVRERRKALCIGGHERRPAQATLGEIRGRLHTPGLELARPIFSVGSRRIRGAAVARPRLPAGLSFEFARELSTVRANGACRAASEGDRVPRAQRNPGSPTEGRRPIFLDPRRCAPFHFPPPGCFTAGSGITPDRSQVSTTHLR